VVPGRSDNTNSYNLGNKANFEEAEVFGEEGASQMLEEL